MMPGKCAVLPYGVGPRTPVDLAVPQAYRHRNSSAKRAKAGAGNGFHRRPATEKVRQGPGRSVGLVAPRPRDRIAPGRRGPRPKRRSRPRAACGENLRCSNCVVITHEEWRRWSTRARTCANQPCAIISPAIESARRRRSRPHRSQWSAFTASPTRRGSTTTSLAPRARAVGDCTGRGGATRCSVWPQSRMHRPHRSPGCPSPPVVNAVAKSRCQNRFVGVAVVGRPKALISRLIHGPASEIAVPERW